MRFTVPLAACALALLAGCTPTESVEDPGPVVNAAPRVTAGDDLEQRHADSTTSTTAPSPTPSSTPELPPGPSGHSFPVQPPDVASYSPAHHDYPATDIFAPCGSSVVAVASGRVLEVSRTDEWTHSVNDGATRGGLSITMSTDDGVRYYGSHLQDVRPEVEPGVRVEVGQEIGRVGDTGNAAGTGCHLHFGISPPCGLGDWQVRRGTIPPAPYLDAWRAGDTTRSPAAEVRDWRQNNRAACP